MDEEKVEQAIQYAHDCGFDEDYADGLAQRENDKEPA